MNTIQNILNGLTSEQIFKLGVLQAAFSNQKFARENIKKVLVEHNENLNYRKTCPPFEEVCNSADLRVEGSQHALWEAIKRKRQQEKFYKRCKHEALEAGISQQVIARFVGFLDSLGSHG